MALAKFARRSYGLHWVWPASKSHTSKSSSRCSDRGARVDTAMQVVAAHEAIGNKQDNAALAN
jgi:hypothetical protein